MPGNALAPRLVDQHGCVARGLRLAILQDGEEIELACELRRSAAFERKSMGTGVAPSIQRAVIRTSSRRCRGGRSRP